MKTKRNMNRRDFLAYGGIGTLGAAGAFQLAEPLSAEEPPEGMTPVEVDGVVDMEEFHSVLILKDPAKDRYLQVWVSFYQANLIRVAMSDEEPRRPLTYEFMENLLDAAGVKILYAAVTELRYMTFHANIAIETGGKILKLDCRPSDGIALAVQTGAKVYVSAKTMNEEARSKKEIEERLRRAEPLKMA